MLRRFRPLAPLRKRSCYGVSLLCPGALRLQTARRSFLWRQAARSLVKVTVVIAITAPHPLPALELQDAQVSIASNAIGDRVRAPGVSEFLRGYPRQQRC